MASGVGTSCIFTFDPHLQESEVLLPQNSFWFLKSLALHFLPHLREPAPRGSHRQSFSLNSLGGEYLAARTLRLLGRKGARQRGGELSHPSIWITHLPLESRRARGRSVPRSSSASSVKPVLQTLRSYGFWLLVRSYPVGCSNQPLRSVCCYINDPCSCGQVSEEKRAERNRGSFAARPGGPRTQLARSRRIVLESRVVLTIAVETLRSPHSWK